MKGNVIPLVGSKRAATPKLITACICMIANSPSPTNNKNGSLWISNLDTVRNNITTKSVKIKMNTIRPNSSMATAMIKSVWASGIYFLTFPSPVPTPKSPPVLYASIDFST